MSDRYAAPRAARGAALRNLAPPLLAFNSDLYLPLLSACSCCRIAYEEGLVIATCAGCGVQHLIADHLGWFGDSGTVEDFVKGKGGLAMRRTATGKKTSQATAQETFSLEDLVQGGSY